MLSPASSNLFGSFSPSPVTANALMPATAESSAHQAAELSKAAAVVDTSSGGRSQSEMQLLRSQLAQTHLADAATRSSLADNKLSKVGDEGFQVIVKYLPSNITQEGMSSMFAKFGTITHCKLIRDRLTGNSLGYGFVGFDNESSCVRAAQELNEKRLEGKIIKVVVAKPLPQVHKESAKANIYIAGLPRGFTKEQMNQSFSEHGKILESRILLDQNGISRGIGFVRFESAENAARAIDQLNGRTLGGGETLIVKYARDSASGNRPGFVRGPHGAMDPHFAFAGGVGFGGPQFGHYAGAGPTYVTAPTHTSDDYYHYQQQQQQQPIFYQTGLSVSPMQSYTTLVSGTAGELLSPVSTSQSADAFVVNVPSPSSSPAPSSPLSSGNVSPGGSVEQHARTLSTGSGSHSHLTVPVPNFLAASAPSGASAGVATGAMQSVSPMPVLQLPMVQSQQPPQQQQQQFLSQPLQQSAEFKQIAGQPQPPLLSMSHQQALQMQQVASTVGPTSAASAALYSAAGGFGGAGAGVVGGSQVLPPGMVSSRVSGPRSSPTSSQSNDRAGVCLFVFHLPPDLKEEELYNMFSTCGQVLSTKIVLDANNQSRGYGFVNMATFQEAQNAIFRLNGARCGNKYLKVSFKKRKM